MSGKTQDWSKGKKIVGKSKVESESCDSEAGTDIFHHLFLSQSHNFPTLPYFFLLSYFIYSNPMPFQTLGLKTDISHYLFLPQSRNSLTLSYFLFH